MTYTEAKEIHTGDRILAKLGNDTRVVTVKNIGSQGDGAPYFYFREVRQGLSWRDCEILTAEEEAHRRHIAALQ